MTVCVPHLIVALLAGWSVVTPAWSADPLQLEAKIPLGNVSGRIDHFAYDAQRHLLRPCEPSPTRHCRYSRLARRCGTSSPRLACRR